MPIYATHNVTSLTGPYEVIAPEWCGEQTCLAVVQELERAGQLPHRMAGTMEGGGFGIGFGGGQMLVGGLACEVLIAERLVRIDEVDPAGEASET